MTLARTLAVLVTLPLVSCATLAPRDTPVAAARRILAADNARDVNAAVDCYTDDVVWMPPNEPMVRGKDAIRARYEALFGAFELDIRSQPESGWNNGDRACECGVIRGRLVPRAGGEAKELDDKYLMLLRRENDGRWRIERLMWSPNAKR